MLGRHLSAEEWFILEGRRRGHEIYNHFTRISGEVSTMNDTSDADTSTVACPTCDSSNTVQIAARGLQYQCRDCSNEFDPTAGPMGIELR
jgi:ribosomal protein L37AE/L43A